MQPDGYVKVIDLVSVEFEGSLLANTDIVGEPQDKIAVADVGAVARNSEGGLEAEIRSCVSRE